MGSLLQLIHFYNVINFHPKHHLSILRICVEYLPCTQAPTGYLRPKELLEQCFKVAITKIQSLKVHNREVSHFLAGRNHSL